MPLSEASREKIKLRATFFNSLAIGLVLVGAFTPFSRISYDPAIKGSDFIMMAVSAAVCFGLGFALHLYAARQLDNLER